MFRRVAGFGVKPHGKACFRVFPSNHLATLPICDYECGFFDGSLPMLPTDILMDEHRIIEQALDCLEKLLEQCMAENKLDVQSASQLIDFFRGFADRCHHGKEEEQLFPMMEANGFSGGCSPVVVMLREHELGRLYIRGMEDAIEPAAAGDPESLKWFVQHSRSYLKLLREHIHKEDVCLFPAANHRLTEKDQKQLLAGFEKVEAEEIGPGVHDRFLRSVNELSDRLGVPRATAAHQHHGSHAEHSARRCAR
jgi:hemerythrin-like domain-containing protein